MTMQLKCRNCETFFEFTKMQIKKDLPKEKEYQVQEVHIKDEEVTTTETKKYFFNLLSRDIEKIEHFETFDLWKIWYSTYYIVCPACTCKNGLKKEECRKEKYCTQRRRTF